MVLNTEEMRQGIYYVRDIYGWMVPAFLLIVAVLSMVFLRPIAFIIIVLPFTIIFLLTLYIGYFVQHRFGRKPLLEERVLSSLMALAEEGGEVTMAELAESQACDQTELARSLHALHDISLLSFFWDTRTERIHVPRAVRIVTHCPQCATDIPVGAVRGRCINCHVYFSRSERKKNVV